MKNFSIRALNDRIFLIKDKQPEKKGSIFLLPSKGNPAPPYTGVIISIGDKVSDPDIQIGGRIAFHDISGVSFKVGDYEIFSIRYTDVTFIFENE